MISQSGKECKIATFNKRYSKTAEQCFKKLKPGIQSFAAESLMIVTT